MNGYVELIKQLQESKKDIASFRQVVLHAHSPGSYDYDNVPVGEISGDITTEFTPEEEFKNVIKSSDIDLLAITDHMKCAFACDVSQSMAGRDICILPGMEINIRPSPPWNTFRLHVLVIFPEGHSLEQICKILPPEIPDETKRTGQEEITNIELPAFVKAVHTCGGICIAAHIDTDRGIRRAFRQLGRDSIVFYDPNGVLTQEEERQISDKFKDWIFSSGFDAIEVGKSSDKKHYRWIAAGRGYKVSIPALLKNDAHHVSLLSAPDRITHIKMTSVSHDGLMQALLFPDTRVRFPNDVPEIPCPHIMGLEIVAGDEGGFFNHLQIAFSENLTCMIGPRGSGKSTIIEALRYSFGYNRRLEEMDQAGGELAKKARSLQQATLQKCVIRVVYCGVDKETHILEAAYDPKQDYATRVYAIDGEDQEIHDIQSSGIYPLRLFGWSEIETLGRERHRQRELLDRLVPDLFKKLEQRSIIRANLVAKRKNIETSTSNLSNIMRKNQGEIRRYKEYKSDFEKLNTQEIKDLFAEIDIAMVQETILSKVQANAQVWIDTLTESKDTELGEGVSELLAEHIENLQTWWIQTKEEIKLASIQADIQGEITKAIASLSDLIETLERLVKQTQQTIQEKDKTIREKVSEEASKQVAAELRRTAGERLQRAKQLRRDYNEEWNHLQNLLSDWTMLAKSLSDLQDEISGKRAKRKEQIEARLNQFGSAEMSISLSFAAGRDRNQFTNHLKDCGILSGELHGHYKANLWPEKIASICDPIEFTKSLLSKDANKLVGTVKLSDGEAIGVDQQMAERLTATLYPFGHDEDADVSIVYDQKLKKILCAAETEWDDVEGVLLNNRAVENLSPGQRSSAMLPLIALVENAPLIIDQPEDNLDNRLVGKMIVDILADLKEKRQIIVATHNPNIVVSGDAEQVIVLDALSVSKGECSCCGSIDNQEIVHSVVEIMEGGKEAFLNRSRRYGLD